MSILGGKQKPTIINSKENTQPLLTKSIAEKAWEHIKNVFSIASDAYSIIDDFKHDKTKLFTNEALQKYFKKAIEWFMKNEPFEVHLWAGKPEGYQLEKPPFGLNLGPNFYQYSGPNTQFLKRESMGQRGINDLDNACYYHDKVYHNAKDVNDENRKKRREADEELLTKAKQFVMNSSKMLDIINGLIVVFAISKKLQMGIF
jgi:hypothetical protein